MSAPACLPLVGPESWKTLRKEIQIPLSSDLRSGSSFDEKMLRSLQWRAELALDLRLSGGTAAATTSMVAVDLYSSPVRQSNRGTLAPVYQTASMVRASSLADGGANVAATVKRSTWNSGGSGWLSGCAAAAMTSDRRSLRRCPRDFFGHKGLLPVAVDLRGVASRGRIPLPGGMLHRAQSASRVAPASSRRRRSGCSTPLSFTLRGSQSRMICNSSSRSFIRLISCNCFSGS